MISVSRSTSPMIDVTSRRASSPRSTISSPSNSAFRPIDASGLRTSCAMCAAIRPTVARRSDRIRRCSRSWIASAIASNSRARSPISSRDVTPGSLRIVAAAQPARVGAQHRQRPQRPQREQQRRARDRQPRRPQRERDRQRRLLVIGQPLRDLPALAAQRPPHPVQVVRQHREVTLELRARLGIDGGRRRPQLAGDAVQLHAERGDLAPPVLEVRPPRRSRLLLEVAVDHAQRVVEVLAPHAQGQRQVRIEPRRGPAAQRRREVVERLPGRVDRPLQLQIGLVRHHALARAMDGQQREGRVDRERQQQDAQREQDLETHVRTLARPVRFPHF